MDFGYTWIDDMVLRNQAAELRALASEYMDLIASVRRELTRIEEAWQSESGRRWAEKVWSWSEHAQATVSSMKSTANSIYRYTEEQKTYLEKLEALINGEDC